MNRKPFAVLVLALLSFSLLAVKVKVIEKNSFKDFQKGMFKNVSIGSTGKLTLGPRFKVLSGPAEEFYFSLVAGKNGDIYVGTGHNGTGYKINPSGNAEKIFKSDQLDIYALLLAGNGDIIVGTSPNGKIYRIAGKDKKVSEVFDPEERFIWDMKEDEQGNLICAMGNNGGVYSVSPTGQVDQLFSSEDAHIVSLYLTRDNSLLAGSGDRGILYQIKNRKVKVLYDSPLEEIRGICEDKEGNIYFAAIKSVITTRTSKEFEFGPVFRKGFGEEKQEIKEKSILYCLKNDGVTEEIWSSEEEYIYSLYYDKASHSVIMGTGNSGRMYRIDANGDYSLFLESDSAQVFKIVGNASGFLAMGNNSAFLIQVENGWSNTGIYYSEVQDTKILSRFGKMTWLAEAVPGTTLTLSVRFGNSDNPDQSWTSWSAPFIDPENSNLNTAGYRFIQTRVSLNSQNPNATPVFNAYKIYYMESNLAPEIREISIEKGNVDEKKAKGKEGEEMPRKRLRISWNAQDANQDQMLFNVFLRKVTDKNWIAAQKNLTERNCQLDMEMYEDGKYLLKVEADDSPDNSPALAKRAFLVSLPFLIDSTAPVLRDWVRTGNTVSFSVSDDTSAVHQILYSFDGKNWFSLFPDDLIADSKIEKFNFTLSELSKNPAIFIKVIDEFDNYKVYQREL